MVQTPLPIYLASSSPRRQMLLAQIGLPFTVVPSHVPERVPADDPVGGVEALALAKAQQVARGLARGLVIGADTVVVLGGEVLGKPASAAQAREMLARLSGATHRVLTGLAVVEAGSGEALVSHEETLVTFRPLSPAEIASYVASGEPMDKAGAYGAQGLGAVLISRVEGCFYNVVGLPLARLAEMLAHWGVRILG